MAQDYTLKYVNHVLLSINHALSTCCCNDGVYFWEGVPCDMEIQLRGSLCAEWDKCQYINRTYFDYQSMCAGDEYKICECQRLSIKADTISSPYVPDEITVSYAGAGTLTVDWGTESVTITEGASVNTYSFSDIATDTLTEIFTEINADYPNLTLSPNTLSNNLPPYIVSGEILNFVGASTKYLDTVKAGLIFELDGSTTTLAEYDSNLNTFANNIQTSLNTLGGPTFSVLYNDRASTSSSGYFAVTFGGSACGIPQSELHIDKMRLLYGTYNGAGDAYIEYPNYICGWGTAGTSSNSLDRYYLASGFHTTGCQLERRPSNGPFIHATGGNLAIQCCPQRGVTIGPPQNLNILSSGYNENANFSNLEPTVLYNGACYKVDPFYFMIGKEGRFTRNWKNPARSTYVIPDCRFNEAACDASLVPTNCSPELFLPQLHKDIPWGPFGSYRTNIEEEDHPATAAVGYLAGRVGWDYRPYSYIRTMGEWTRTTGIIVNLKYYRQIDYYIGSNTADDKIGGTIDTSSVPAGFTLTNNTPEASYVQITFDPSGKTVGDFLEGINSLRASGETSDVKCSLFQFCPASTDILNVPAYKILNNSAEIWDMRRNRFDEALHGDGDPDPTGYVQAYNPDTDVITLPNPTDFWNRLMSGSDVYQPEVAYSDRFASVRYGLQAGPNFSYDCYNIFNERISRPTLYVNPPSPVAATLPPYCRHKKTLPNHSGGVVVFTYPLGTTSHLDGDVQPRLMPWWTPMQGTIENLINVRKNPSVPEAISQLLVWVSGRTIHLSGLRFDGVTPVGNLDTIATNRGGATYIVPSAIVDINSIQYTPIGGGSPYSPFLANSGTYPFEVWLDDQTWMDPSNEFPVPSGFPGAVRTSHNWAYVEPLLDSSPTDLINSELAYLQSFVRLRHDWFDEINETYENAPHKLPRCVPPNSPIVGSGIKVDCDGDKVIEGSWIVSYGCTSRVCKTTWFYATQRCPCDTEFQCDEDGGSTVPHKFNQEGDSLTNSERWSETAGNTTYVNQPTLYVCALNFHRDCDIPALVKVPYQVVIDSTDSSCPGSIYLIRYAYTNGVVSTPIGDAADSYDFDFWNGAGESEGWCQWIDPANPGTLISKGDIPRTWPPKAYIAERSTTVLCSTNLYPFTLDELCNDTAIYSLEGWDRIQNIYPYAPPDYSDSQGRGCGTPTDVDGNTLLNALFRPIINNIDNGDLCPGGNCNRVDINCSTKCCGCFFVCNDADGCVSSGPKYYPEEYILTYSESHDYENLVETCDTVPVGVGAGSCNQGCCTDPGGSFVRHPSWGVRYNISISANFTMNVNATCGICLGGGSEEITQTVDDGGCTGDYLPPCADNFCNNGCGSCCDFNITNPIGCNNYLGYRDRALVCDETGNGVFLQETFCGCGSIGTIQCSYPQIIRVTLDTQCTDTFGNCGHGTVTKEVSNVFDANGGSTGGPDCRGGDPGILQYPDGNKALGTESQTASFTQSPSTYGGCTGGTQDGQELGYVTGWLNGATWYCGINGFKTSIDDSEYI